MNANSFIVEEYLASLKEDTELDYLFPLLLKMMGFKIIRTPKEAKGQNQYGKDVIAIGNDENGLKYKWYFELKGHADRNIDENNFHKSDGILESLREAKFVDYNDFSIPELQLLPTKIVLVHNGILKANFLSTFNGFILKELDGYNFERWDIYKLTDLFSKYLFSEYLLLDTESSMLLKKTLAFWDIAGYNFNEFYKLVNLQFKKQTKIKGRALNKMFATLGLLQTLVFHYSKENNNLHPAKECSKYLILQTWNWILKNNLETKRSIKDEFQKLLNIQFEILSSYFKKTFPVARIPNGLYAENGLFFEKLGYPLRCFDYLDDMIFFCRLREGYSRNNRKLNDKLKDLLIEVVENNPGFYRPIVDRHSIPIMQLFVYFDNKHWRQKDMEFIYKYVYQVADNILLEKVKNKLLPELNNNLGVVAEAMATGDKPEEYNDSSSILVAFLLELSAVFNSKKLFTHILESIDRDVSLQIPSIDFCEHEVEQLLFEKNLHSEYFVECIERIPTTNEFLKDKMDFDEFRELTISRKAESPIYRTDQAGYSYLRYLTHSYFKNELLPFEWRKSIKPDD